MSKPLIYIDQNVLGLHLEGALNLATIDEFQWVYSKEHFAEIRRSDTPQKYLEALKNINAKLLALKLENWKITGEAELIEAGSPTEQYAEYLEAIDQIEFNESTFDGFQVWVNGGGDEALLRSIPEQFSAQIQALSDRLPAELRGKLREDSEPAFSEMIEQMVSQGNDINRTREILGGGKGRFGSIAGKDQLLQVWDIIRPACGTVTSDQFFGFDPPIKQGHDSVPMFLGIASCCAVLDIIGFQAEKKTRRLEKIPNVRSDAAHIGMGAYCTAILSADRRLAKRAKAIYEYKNIGTAALIVEVAG
jgi:hypothetical protein